MSRGWIPRQELKIALAFFGITRSLRLTIESIRRNLVGPAREVAPNVRLFGHFYDQARIENLRSSESGELDRDEYSLLGLDAVERELPGECLSLYPYDAIKAAGDPWKDDFASLNNLVHQLHSLHRVTEMALEWQPHIVVFARPDLFYHDSAIEHLERLASMRRRILVPDWSLWHGYNDRFAIAKGEENIRAYGLRAERMGEYCARRKRLHSERFLKFVLEDSPVRTFGMRASRVRSNGTVMVEDFTPGRGKRGPLVHISFAKFEQTLPLALRAAPVEGT